MAAQSEGKKILVVDDDSFLRNIYARKFGEEKFNVTTAGDGQEALEIIQKGNIPDILFAGIIMPRLTGFELVKKLKADPKFSSIPVVIFSHSGREEDIKTAKSLGVNEFIFQGTVPILEVVRRVKLILGISEYFVITIPRDKDAEGLIKLLEQQRGTSCSHNAVVKVVIKQEKEVGKFDLTLECE